MIPVLFFCLVVQAQNGPKVFIDSVPYAPGAYTGATIISAPEIANRFSLACPECRVTIKKETSDYVLVFAASQAYGGLRWSWAVYENKEGLMLRKGETVLFNNSVKDAATIIRAHWKGEDIRLSLAPEITDQPAVIYVYRKEGGWKTSFNPSIQIDSQGIVNKLTKDKYFALTIEPGRHVFTFRRKGAPPQQFMVDAIPGQETFVKYNSGSLAQPIPTMRLMDRTEALQEMKKLKSEEAKNITDSKRVTDRKPLQ
jgi:hypothetical protein